MAHQVPIPSGDRYKFMNTTKEQYQTSHLRRHERVSEPSSVEIIWADRNGEDRFQRVDTLDISDLGMQIVMTESLQERSYVTVRSEKLRVHGTASVRSCVRKGLKYRVGLEFSAGLRWKTPLE